MDDPTLEPVLEPRPISDAWYLHGLLEGLAEIEARGDSARWEPTTATGDHSRGGAEPAVATFKGTTFAMPGTELHKATSSGGGTPGARGPDNLINFF